MGLLLWKSVYLEQLRRHWVITTMELVTPILLSFVQAYLHCSRQQTAGVTTATTTTTPEGGLDILKAVMPDPVIFPKTIGYVPASGKGT